MREAGDGEARGDRFAMWPKTLQDRIGRDRVMEGIAERRLRVLVVGDNALAAFDLEGSLEQFGHEVVARAASATGAVLAAAEHRPDLVLMDVSLADGSDGIQAAIEIREQVGTPAVFVTGYTDRATRQRAAEARPVGMLHKPVQPVDVAHALQRIAALMA